MDVDVVDDEGRPVRNTLGYLVLKQPAPSMTRGFLNDPQRYIETYFSRWPGVWFHGDWALVDKDGFWFIHGRADDTIKVAGKRTGPAEVESALIAHEAVSEAAAIGIPDELKGETVACFAVLKPGNESSDATLRTPFRPGGGTPGKDPSTQVHLFRQRSSQDAFRENRAWRDQTKVSRRKRRGYFVDRKSRGAGSNPSIDD